MWLNIALSWKITKIRTPVGFKPKISTAFPITGVLFLLCTLCAHFFQDRPINYRFINGKNFSKDIYWFKKSILEKNTGHTQMICLFIQTGCLTLSNYSITSILSAEWNLSGIDLTTPWAQTYRSVFLLLVWCKKKGTKKGCFRGGPDGKRCVFDPACCLADSSHSVSHRRLSIADWTPDSLHVK